MLLVFHEDLLDLFLVENRLLRAAADGLLDGLRVYGDAGLVLCLGGGSGGRTSTFQQGIARIRLCSSRLGLDKLQVVLVTVFIGASALHGGGLLLSRRRLALRLIHGRRYLVSRVVFDRIDILDRFIFDRWLIPRLVFLESFKLELVGLVAIYIRVVSHQGRLARLHLFALFLDCAAEGSSGRLAYFDVRTLLNGCRGEGQVVSAPAVLGAIGHTFGLLA